MLSRILWGIGPASAVPVALTRAGLSLSDIDLFELNDGFFGAVDRVIREIRLDASKVNMSCGAIALRHPIGASGARVLVTLIHALRRKGKAHGVASLCVGGGMGIAMVLSAGE